MYLKHVFGEKQFVSSNLLNMKKIWGEGSTTRESIKRLHTPGVEEGNRKPDTVAA